MTHCPTPNVLKDAIVEALKALGGAGTSKEIEETVIEQLKLPDDVTKVTHASCIGGRTLMSVRLGRARSDLKKLGVIEQTDKGVWSLKADAKFPSGSDSPMPFPIPECSPFDPKSDYAKVFAILFAFRETGISWLNLVACHRAVSGKPKTLAEKDVGAVISAKRDGTSHKSVCTEAPYYFVVDEHGLMTLHLKKASQQASEVLRAMASP
jgi:hypothetical protein